MKICIVPPITKKHPALRNLKKILKAFLPEENVFTLDYSSFIGRVPSIAKGMVYLFDEINISIKLLNVLRKVDIVLIFQIQRFLPALIARISRKKVLSFIGGDPTAYSFYDMQTNSSLLNKILYTSNVLLTKIYNLLPHTIVTITPSMLNLNLRKYKNKLRFASIFPGFFPKSPFDIKQQYDKREQVIGFVGSLEKIKGIVNFCEALPHIFKETDHLSVFIIGEGSLSNFLRLKLKKYCDMGLVKFFGWVPHIKLPYYYNKFKLLILPSYSEGIPSVILEAMACGTPVLATPVGGIPNIIKDGETGFLLKSNDPKHIAKRIIELLNKPDLLKKVSINAYNYVRENFSYEKTLEAWRKILSELQSNK